MTQHPQLPLPITAGEKSSFANFFSADNAELVAAIQNAVRREHPTLLFLYGPNGSGKSHLLFAAVRLAGELRRPCSYVSLSDPKLLQLEATTSLLQMVNANHLVCIDDLIAWAGDPEKERELFALFEQIRHAGGSLLISSERAPDRSGIGLRDLVSRLSGGLIYAVRLLSDEQNFLAIKLRANERGLKIGDEVVRYLLNRSSRDTAELFDLLDRIDTQSLIEKRRITIPFLQRIL